MNYTVREEAGARVVALAGQFTFDATDDFRAVIDELEGGRVQRCVLEMSGLDFIDSAGLGLLVLANAAAGRKGIALSMRHPRGQVREMIEIAEFQTIIPCEFEPA